MPARTEAATRERLRRAAHRAVDNPVKLASATRIVQAAVERGKLTVAELVESAPPLTPEQIDRLRALLPPPSAPAEREAS